MNKIMGSTTITVCLILLAAGVHPPAAGGQSGPPTGADAARSMVFQDLSFNPPTVGKRTLASGVPVFLMEDRTLPLVTIYARFRGGSALLPRESYAPAFALPSLLRSGGTKNLPPDSVDFLLDYYALQMTFGGGGQSTFSSMNTLSRHVRPAINLWGDILQNPRFEKREVEIWRARQLEGIRRRGDDPGRLAISEFNRIMFGDHPIGWELESDDLTTARLSTETMSQVHGRILCPENLILGVVGDISWEEAKPLLDGMLDGWPSCTEPLLEPRIPDMREGPGVFLIPKDVTQSHIVVAGPGGIQQGTDPDYFASRIGNSILGAGGFSSRLLSRVRTDEGFAYGASSFWTTPSRFQGIVGATTQTKSESTVQVTQLLLELIGELADAPPSEEEVDRVVSQIVNSFVFNFQDPAQIVSRQMFYLAQGLPPDWLERYVRGIQAVEPDDVQDVFRRHVDPGSMTILIIGNPEDFDFRPDVLGDVTIWDSGARNRVNGLPREGPRSHH